MARPRKEINWEEFDKLCGLHATQEEIANWFSVSVDTIDRAVKREHKVGFAEYYRQKATVGKISLRRKQFELAQSGDRTMLIWLGKQHLGQSEKMEQKIDMHLQQELERLMKLSESELMEMLKAIVPGK